MDAFEPGSQGRQPKRQILVITGVVGALAAVGAVSYFFVTGSSKTTSVQAVRSTEKDPVAAVPFASAPATFSGAWTRMGFPAAATSYRVARSVPNGVAFFGEDKGQLSMLTFGERGLVGKPTRLPYPVEAPIAVLCKADGSVEHVMTTEKGQAVVHSVGADGATTKTPMQTAWDITWVGLERDAKGTPIAFAATDKSAVLAAAYEEGKWGGWVNVGGALQAPPVAAALGPVVEFFGLGSDFQFYSNTYAGAATTHVWQQAGAGGASGGPAILSLGDKNTVIAAGTTREGELAIWRRQEGQKNWTVSRSAPAMLKGATHLVRSQDDEVLALMEDDKGQTQAVAFKISDGAVSAPQTVGAGSVVVAGSFQNRVAFALTKGTESALWVYREKGATNETAEPSAEAAPKAADKRAPASAKKKK